MDVIYTVGERFEAPECLFTPSLIDCEKPGMADMVFEMIQSADLDTRRSYYKHIVLSEAHPCILASHPAWRRTSVLVFKMMCSRVLTWKKMKKFKVNIEDPPAQAWCFWAVPLGRYHEGSRGVLDDQAEYDEQGLSIIKKIGRS